MDRWAWMGLSGPSFVGEPGGETEGGDSEAAALATKAVSPSSVIGRAFAPGRWIGSSGPRSAIGRPSPGGAGLNRVVEGEGGMGVCGECQGDACVPEEAPPEHTGPYRTRLHQDFLEPLSPGENPPSAPGNQLRAPLASGEAWCGRRRPADSECCRDEDASWSVRCSEVTGFRSDGWMGSGRWVSATWWDEQSGGGCL